MKFLLWSKAKLWAAGALLLTVLGFLLRLKFVTYQRDKAETRADTYEAQLHQKRLTEEADAEIEAEYSDLSREAARDLREGDIPAHLRDPEDWR